MTVKTGLTQMALMTDYPRCTSCMRDLEFFGGQASIGFCRRCLVVFDTRPGRMPLTSHLRIESSHLKTIKVKPFVNSGMIAPASVPQEMMVESFHHSELSPARSHLSWLMVSSSPS